MICFTGEDIFKLQVKALVNPVNCVGIMGAGLALEFKKQFPDLFEAYRLKCLEKKIKLGSIWPFTVIRPFGTQYIYNFPTKRSYTDMSCLEDIEKGLENLLRCIKHWRTESVVVPFLGCGLGGLNKADVFDLICRTFNREMEITVLIPFPKDKLFDIFCK
jgi:O-acetyl-ADP-ribose deacetylase (regulator of RNase III)